MIANINKNILLTKYSFISNYFADKEFNIYFSLPLEENFPKERISVELRVTRKSSLKSLEKLISLLLKQLPKKYRKVDILPSDITFSVLKRNSFLEINFGYSLNNMSFWVGTVYNDKYLPVFSLSINCKEEYYILSRKNSEEIIENIKNIFGKVIFPIVLKDYKAYKKRRSLWTYLKIPKQKSKNIKMRI